MASGSSRLLGLTLAGLLLPAAAAAQPAPWRAPLAETPCSDVPGLDQRPEAERARVRCGRLTVPLDHADPNGRTITLGVAVRAAAAPTARAPLLILNGGSFGSLRSVGPSFAAPYPQDRDVWLIDPRGMDASGMGVCQDTTRRKIAAMAGDLEGEALRTAYNAPLRPCREEMRRAGVPPHVFGAVAMARDVEALRVALGPERLLMIGQSQGTTVAATYAALFPDRPEAMVLDSPYPADPTPKSLTDSFREGLTGAAAWCRGQHVCGPARYRLVEAYDAAFAALRREPVTLRTETFGPFVLNADDFNLLVQNMLYPGVARAVATEVTPHAIAPAFIAAAEARDAALAGRLADQSLRRLANGPHSGTFVSAECRDRPRYRRRPLPFTGVELIDMSAICGWWTDAPVDPVRVPPIGSVPTLVLSGTTDPITPVSFGREMTRRLGRSARQLVVPGFGHGLASPSPCARAVTLAFLTEPRLDAVPSTCAQP
jgi:pimeloyl-ACP methyl ester carboxylesterase